MPYPRHLHNERLMPADLPKPRRVNQVVEIILLKPEILHDIEAGIHQIEKSRPADAPTLLAAGGADDYLLSRYVDTAVNQAVSRCQAYLLLPSPYVQRISTDHVSGWEEKDIFLALPHNWPPHCINPLRDAVHSFIVMRAMQLFLSFADEKAAAVCDAQAYSFWNDINTALNTRLGPTHIHPTFLG